MTNAAMAATPGNSYDLVQELYETAALFEKEGDFKTALIFLNQIFSHDPYHLTSLILQAKIWRKKTLIPSSHIEQALALYDTNLGRHRQQQYCSQSHEVTLSKLAQVYLKLEQLDKARSCIKDLLTISPDGPIGWGQLCMLELACNNPQAARNAARMSVRLNPENPVGYNHLCQAELACGEEHNIQNAIDIATKWHTKSPLDSSFLLLLGKIALYYNRRDEAHDITVKLLELPFRASHLYFAKTATLLGVRDRKDYCDLLAFLKKEGYIHDTVFDLEYKPDETIHCLSASMFRTLSMQVADFGGGRRIYEMKETIVLPANAGSGNIVDRKLTTMLVTALEKKTDPNWHPPGVIFEIPAP